MATEIMKKEIKKKNEMPEGQKSKPKGCPFTGEFNQVNPGDDPGNGELPLTQLPVQKSIMGSIQKRRTIRMRKLALWDMPGSVMGLEDTRNLGTSREEGAGNPFGSGGESPIKNQSLPEKDWKQLWDRFTRMTQNYTRNPEGGNSVEKKDALDSGQAPSSEDANP